MGTQSEAGANGAEGGPPCSEAHQHRPKRLEDSGGWQGSGWWQKRARARQKTKKKKKEDADLAGVFGSQSEASEESFGFSEEEIEQIDKKEEAAASSSQAGPAKTAPAAGPDKKRGNQSRGYPWGPFIISPIVPAGGQTGWGAICNMHLDKADSGHTGCKKSVSLSLCGNSHEECILRLKRWLLAGLEDHTWPKQRLRSHHVQMGGKGMVDFAHGLTESELDTQLEAWLAKG